MNILFNITDVLTLHFRCHQIYTYEHTVFAYLRACLTYIKQVTTHTMVYVDTTTTNILSPDILPVKELKGMLRHSELQLTLNNVSTHIVGYHTSFLLISQDTCASSRWTIFTLHRCTDTGESTKTPHI